MKQDDLDDPNAEVMALEAEVQRLQQALHQCVRDLIESSPYSRWLVQPNDSIKAAAADPAALRASVSAGNADHSALVALLVALEVIELEDYQRARVDMLRLEVTAYETVLAERMEQAERRG